MSKKWNMSKARRATINQDSLIEAGPAAPGFKNPKRGKAAARFAFYANPKCKTVKDYVEKHGTTSLMDICWDLDHGFIVLKAPPAASAPTQKK